MVSRRLRGAAVAVVCAVALSSCGNAHPGQAAQVGDVSISQDRLQQSTSGFCDLIDAINQAQGADVTVPVRSALLTALNTIVMGEALDQLAARRGVEVSSAEVAAWIDQLPIDLGQAPPSRADELRAVTERVARNSLLVEKLGQQAFEQQNTGAQPATEQIQQLGQQAVSRYMREVGVDVNPRYGQVLDTQKLPGTGSLSVPVSQEGRSAQTVPEANSTLTETQECF